MTTGFETARFHGMNRRVFGATATVVVATVLVKIVSAVKEFIVARRFGRSDELEAFLLAALVPGLLINLISESMNQALIPTLVRLREKGSRESAQRLLSNCLAGSCLLLVVGSVLMGIFARWLLPVIGSHFESSKIELAVRLSYGLLPVVVLTGLASTFSAVLNSAGEFVIPASAPMVTSLALIVGILVFPSAGGPWVLVYGMIAGSLVHAGWMAGCVRARGFQLRLHWCGMDRATRDVAMQFGPLVLSGVVASGGLVVDQGMAATLPAGSLSALVYAGRFISLPMALLGGAVSTALTPAFSEMIARDEWDDCRRLMRVWAWGSLAAACAVSTGLVVGARTLVRLTLQHGVFGTGDTSAVSQVLVMYAMQIPFFVSSRVFYRFLVAARRTDIVFYCGLLNLGLDVGLNIVLMRRMGVAGIALASSLWTVSTFMFLLYWSGRVLKSSKHGAESTQVGDCQLAHRGRGIRNG